ncbi:transcription repressor OFP7-like [Forsythia ovata]|uniref:Transcription repressor n=1 Tax=Forsythia ovata TaxID=205694 RepID=A0ABD1U7N5_9LAMI
MLRCYIDSLASKISNKSAVSSSPTGIDPLEKNLKNVKIRRSKNGQKATTTGTNPERMIPCMIDGKVSESFAVMKRSINPYQDFKKSMLEMIMEKEMFEAMEMEQLLQCFLSLNSQQHHAVIVKVFTEIWEEFFTQSSNYSLKKM